MYFFASLLWHFMRRSSWLPSRKLSRLLNIVYEVSLMFNVWNSTYAVLHRFEMQLEWVPVWCGLHQTAETRWGTNRSKHVKFISHRMILLNNVKSEKKPEIPLFWGDKLRQELILCGYWLKFWGNLTIILNVLINLNRHWHL